MPGAGRRPSSPSAPRSASPAGRDSRRREWGTPRNRGCPLCTRPTADLPLGQDGTAESVQRAGRKSRAQFLQWSCGQPCGSSAVAASRSVDARRRSMPRRGARDRAPQHAMRTEQVRRRLLHELHAQRTDLPPPLEERRQALVRVILGIVHQHQRERRSRPLAVAASRQTRPNWGMTRQ